MNHNPFKNRKLLIATKHKKENVIAPLLEDRISVNCLVDLSIDTDLLGTFTGEFERKDDPITTARKKCLLAKELSNYDLILASEGSFGNHPEIPFIPANEEYIVLIDFKNDFEIIAKEFNTDTNFKGQRVHSIEELKEFAMSSLFPSHGLILRQESTSKKLKKGISDWDDLFETFSLFIKENSYVFVETDMRAMHNPTRMKNIEKATKNLLDTIHSYCPICNTPGFIIEKATRGLPCENCNFPTQSILFFTWQCKKCSFEKIEKFPNGKKVENPMYCDICNP